MKKITFLTDDQIKLDGLLYEPNIISKEIVISIHGMTSNCFKKRDDIFAEEITKKGLAYFCFNNRGHDLAVYLDKYVDGKRTKIIAGTSYEDVLESYYDITGAIKTMVNLGYEKIHLQGHSFGSTKIVYTYNRLKAENNQELLSKISSVILLSLVDLIGIQKYYLRDKYDELLQYAIQKEKEDKLHELMPTNSFINPISVKSYLRCFRDNEEINFSRYADSNYDFKELNNISVPLFIRWGNVKELIAQDAKDLSVFLNSKVTNTCKDIGYIEGANHSYDEKEVILINEILDFINKNKNLNS